MVSRFYKERIDGPSERYWIKRKKSGRIAGIEDSSYNREFFPFTTILNFDDTLGNGDDFSYGIKKARDSLETTGGIVFMPDGRYLGKETITIDVPGVHIMGAGWPTEIYRTTDYGDTFLFTGNDASGTLLNNAGLSRIRFTSAGKTTSGAHVHANGVVFVDYSNIWIVNGFKGYQFDGLSQAFLTNLFCVYNDLYTGDYAGRCYMQFGNATGSYSHPDSGGVWANNIQLRSSPIGQNFADYSIVIYSADGIWLNNGHVGGGSIACINISATTSRAPSLIYFSNFMTDDTPGHALQFEGSTTEGFDFAWTGGSMKGGAYGKKGIYVAPGAKFYETRFGGGLAVYQFNLEGLDIQSADFRKATFDGVDFYANGKTSDVGLVGTIPGINLADNVREITFNGGRSGGNITASSVGTQSYGMKVGAGLTKVKVNNMDLLGNINGSFDMSGADATTRANFKVKDCDTMESTSIASAATVTLPPSGESFTITGTTTITNITASWSQRRVTLVFANALTLTDGGNLKLAGSLTTTSDDAITLISDGTNWIETSRSVN
jgi:hypothetical protein